MGHTCRSNTHRFPITDRRAVELKLTAPTCRWAGCPHTICVEGWTVTPTSSERRWPMSENFELIPTILPEVRRLANDQLSQDMADEAGVLHGRGEHQRAVVMIARSLAISLDDDHPVTRWVTGIAETFTREQTS